MDSQLTNIDNIRQVISKKIDPNRKSMLGQYFTPSVIAEYMASLFIIDNLTDFSILDPGAGIGSLSIALLQRLASKEITKSIKWIGYEIDQDFIKPLEQNLLEIQNSLLQSGHQFYPKIFVEDFIKATVTNIINNEQELFDLIVINPPYKKIQSNSDHRFFLRSVGIETVNLYSAFLALSMDLLTPNGQIVAIVPRSFCNGPYFKSFREKLLKNTVIMHIHSFEQRDKAFIDDDVLQENVIIHLQKKGQKGNVKISFSSGKNFEKQKNMIFPYEMIVKPGDPDLTIHIPTDTKPQSKALSDKYKCSLSDIGVTVSTGPIVDFRVKEFLIDNPTPDAIPLLYPNHFGNLIIDWPRLGIKKANSIRFDNNLRNQFYKKGYYVVTRRFSSKEEKRRIYANVVDPAIFSQDFLGFENHLNVFHIKREGLEQELAYGLGTYLNSTFLDVQFRQFSGHTQVNVNDFKLLRFPSLQIIKSIGRWALTQGEFTQESIDREVNKYVL